MAVETGSSRCRVVHRRLAVDPIHLDVVDIGDPDVGPTVALVGGVHGDEDEGVLSVRRVVARLSATPINGRLRALAMANPPAYAARSRCSPADGLNLARVFPGDAGGSLTQRIARVITEEVIAGAGLLVDLHSAGRDFAMPLFCGYHHIGTAPSRIAAEAAARFGIELLWAHTTVSEGRTLSAAAHLGVPAIYAEASGGGEVRGDQTDRYVDGVLRLLGWMGLIEHSAEAVAPRRVVHGGREDQQGSITAGAGGTMVTRVRAGQVVEAGGIIAEIYDSRGHRVETIAADGPAIVMKLRRSARVTPDDQIAVLAPAPQSWRRAVSGASGAAPVT